MKDGNRTKVVLLSGEIVDTWSEGWRLECMERKPHVDMILSMLGKSNRAKRDAYYKRLGETRGLEYEKRVRDAVARVWKLEGERMKDAAK